MKRFFVLGCHRSATSLVAKALHEQGVSMGDRLIGTSPDQPHGHYEHTTAVSINEGILTACDGTWRNPPARERLLAHRSTEVLRYIKGRDNPNSWGLKDPRLCLTWPTWLAALQEVGYDDTHLVTIWRRPTRIADSLVRRDGRLLGDWLPLVDRYLQDLRANIDMTLAAVP